MSTHIERLVPEFEPTETQKLITRNGQAIEHRVISSHELRHVFWGKLGL